MGKIITVICTCVFMATSVMAQTRITVRNSDTEKTMEEETPHGLRISTVQENWEDSVRIYIEKGRWGNKEAFEKLASYYHDGLGVKHSFTNMLFMYVQANEYGGHSMEIYMQRYEANDPDRLLFDGMNDIDQKRLDDFENKVNLLKVMNQPSCITLSAFKTAEIDKNEEKAENLFNEAAEKGCELSKLLVIKQAEEKRDIAEYEKKLWEATTTMPIAYNLLGKLYLGYGHDVDSLFNIDRAVSCFKKADENAFLTKSNAKRLLQCYEVELWNGKEICDSTEVERLRHLVQSDLSGKKEVSETCEEE